MEKLVVGMEKWVVDKEKLVAVDYLVVLYMD